MRVCQYWSIDCSIVLSPPGFSPGSITFRLGACPFWAIARDIFCACFGEGCQAANPALIPTITNSADSIASSRRFARSLFCITISLCIVGRFESSKVRTLVQHVDNVRTFEPSNFRTYRGAMGGAPPMPKLPLCRLKSLTLTTWSPVMSARLSYWASPIILPKVFFKMLKSVALTTLLLSQSPALCRPISCWVVGAPVSVTLPEVASQPGLYSGGVAPSWALFTRQLYAPGSRLLTFTVKKPLASVVWTG